MQGTKLDLKNSQLVWLISNLRQYLDLHRVIGLNVDALKIHGVSIALWGTIQIAAHDEIILILCKIYEREDRFERNSIPGIINDLPALDVSDELRADVTRFGAKHGNQAPCHCVKCYLQETLNMFRAVNQDTFARIKRYRNQFGAHSQHGAEPFATPSHASFEVLMGFAEDFYKLISRGIVDAAPALVSGLSGSGLVKLMGRLGIEKPQFNFAD